MVAVAARQSGSRLLQAHFDFIGTRISSARDFRRLSDGGGDEREVLAVEFAAAAAKLPHGVGLDLVGRLQRVFPPEALVELLLAAGLSTTLKRLSSAGEHELEPEIAAMNS